MPTIVKDSLISADLFLANVRIADRTIRAGFCAVKESGHWRIGQRVGLTDGEQAYYVKFPNEHGFNVTLERLD